MELRNYSGKVGAYAILCHLQDSKDDTFIHVPLWDQMHAAAFKAIDGGFLNNNPRPAINEAFRQIGQAVMRQPELALSPEGSRKVWAIDIARARVWDMASKKDRKGMIEVDDYNRDQHELEFEKVEFTDE